MQRRGPIDLHDEDQGHVSEQHHRQPFQEGRIFAVGNEELEQQRDDREADREDMPAAASNQLGGVAHRGKVGADIDRIGDEQEPDQHHHDPSRHDLAQVPGEPVSRHAADPRADQLHRAHQRIGQHHRPQQHRAERRAGLRICGDTARIVVGRSGDQPGTQLFEDALQVHTNPHLCQQHSILRRVRFHRDGDHAGGTGNGGWRDCKSTGVALAAPWSGGCSGRQDSPPASGRGTRHRDASNSSNVWSWRRPRQPASASACRLPPLRPLVKSWSACTM